MDFSYWATLLLKATFKLWIIQKGKHMQSQELLTTIPSSFVSKLYEKMMVVENLEKLSHITLYNLQMTPLTFHLSVHFLSVQLQRHHKYVTPIIGLVKCCGNHLCIAKRNMRGGLEKGIGALVNHLKQVFCF